MKKMAMSLGLSFACMASAFAADTALEQLNTQVASVLESFQNQTTSAFFSFSELELNQKRAEKIALNGHYKKTGSENIFGLNIKNLSYSYGDGLNPLIALNGSIDFDITKMVPQEVLNDLIPTAAEKIEEFAHNFTNLGDAADVKSIVTSTTKDSEGNYTGLTAFVSVTLDFTKLPEDTTAKEIPFKSFSCSFGIDLKKGFEIDGFIISNPEYQGFEQDQDGLKEYIERFIEGDEVTVMNAHFLIFKLDSSIEELVETNASLKSLWSHFKKK